ncbi:ketopantoate reductase family protein [Planctomycetota bacterium]
MDVLIYGAGAVGLGLASCLLKAGAQVDLLARSNTVKAIAENGLQREGIFGSYSASAATLGCYTSLNEIPVKNYTFILVCTKSFDSEQAAQALSQCPSIAQGSTPIVLSQNGWGNAQIFTQHFPTHRIYNARVITGFQRHEPNHVSVTVHADAIHIGSLFDSPLEAIAALAQGITQGDIPCEITPTIDRDLWAKMLFNCTLNPLGAILDVPYGALAEHSSTRDLMDPIVAEIFTVCAAAGYQMHWETPEAFLEIFYGQQVPDTARHRSSTLQDIKAGKRTEIDALNGQIIALSRTLNIDVPYNRAVYRLVKFLEKRQEARMKDE